MIEKDRIEWLEKNINKDAGMFYFNNIKHNQQEYNDNIVLMMLNEFDVDLANQFKKEFNVKTKQDYIDEIKEMYCELYSIDKWNEYKEQEEYEVYSIKELKKEIESFKEKIEEKEQEMVLDY